MGPDEWRMDCQGASKLADSEVSSCPSDLPCADKRPGTWQNQCDMVERCPWLEEEHLAG